MPVEGTDYYYDERGKYHCLTPDEDNSYRSGDYVVTYNAETGKTDTKYVQKNPGCLVGVIAAINIVLTVTAAGLGHFANSYQSNLNIEQTPVTIFDSAILAIPEYDQSACLPQ